MAEKTLVGKVIGCTRVFHVGGIHKIRKVTEFSVESFETNKIEEMKIHGKHGLLISPNRVSLNYIKSSAEYNWVNSYTILDQEGNSIYTEASD